jgi:hypothetical protein
MLCWLKQKYKQFFDWFVISEEDLTFKQTKTEPLKNKKVLITKKKNIKNRKRRRSNQNKIL